MQTTIYYNEEDSYLIRQVDAKSQRERKSRSSVILSILEEYLESQKRLGEILVDIGVLSHSELAKGLELLAAGTDIDYVGASAVELIGPGESAGNYQEIEFADGVYSTIGYR